MAPNDLLKAARKACSGDLLALSNAEARRRARVLMPFCFRADATPTVRTSGFQVWGFSGCVAWAERAKWPYDLNEACARFHEGLRGVAQNDGSLHRLLVEMLQRAL